MHEALVLIFSPDLKCVTCSVCRDQSDRGASIRVSNALKLFNNRSVCSILPSPTAGTAREGLTFLSLAQIEKDFLNSLIPLPMCYSPHLPEYTPLERNDITKQRKSSLGFDVQTF